MENKNGEIINTKNVGNVLNNNVIIETLKNQRLLENEETEDQYILSQKDLDILSDLVSKELRSKGYKLSKKDEFNSKIETIFSINTKCNKYENLGSRYTVFHGNVMDGSEKTLNNNLYESFAETGNIFFDKENQLITNFFLLKTIISETNSNLTISVPENIIARNKYLFNSSKADYVWLMANDPSFLESLVKDFGYVKDNELGLFVIKKNFSDPEEFGKILSYQKCDGTIIINKNIFDIISKANEDDKSKYLRGVANYLVKESKEVALIKNISPSKRIEILGKIAYYSTKIGETCSMYYDFFSILGGVNAGIEYEKEFKDNNYYNISDFKSVWEETRSGGISSSESE